MGFPKKLYIVAAKRTAFGAFNGKVAHLTASELGGIASKAAIADLPAGVPIDVVNYGNVLQTSKDAAYLSRHIGLRAGLPIHVPANTINRLCGSGFQSIVNCAQDILTGDAEIGLAGGTENMSQAPYILRGIRTGLVTVLTSHWRTHWLTDSLISTQSQPQWSQQRWAEAQKKGHFKAEIVPIELKSKKGVESFEVDEHPRPQTTLKTGTVTAGNASGISDGAASLVIASEDAVKKYNLNHFPKFSLGNLLVATQASWVSDLSQHPGCFEACRTWIEGYVSRRSQRGLCFPVLGCRKELGLNREISNSNGGAIALGHPLGASGARIMTHLSHELHRVGGKYAVGSACIGGGQGMPCY
ncbi:hypothetical protein BCR33DRAFT_761305 [Rhizoclosmatium globosum]|uniref:Thiolase n=1 Tax=Rhizoclosmatium globosum TaxID=329046 RepID=A0A1Y2D354_9FUNG|nr:hypothetical protein BCR33DRAFT_761305 [Rhizoclosmatium globosum]|eukprot:ORY52985.1 hypothetical protein BCR33DRAFT_761305 [Rhizoclosmatium globosum]